jgi:hypothetical protein
VQLRLVVRAVLFDTEQALLANGTGLGYAWHYHNDKIVRNAKMRYLSNKFQGVMTHLVLHHFAAEFLLSFSLV